MCFVLCGGALITFGEGFQEEPMRRNAVQKTMFIQDGELSQ